MTMTTDNHPDFFARALMIAGDVPYEERRDGLLEAARSYLDYHRNLCQQDHRSGATGRQVVKAITTMTDTLIYNLHHCVTAEYHTERQATAALIALGGYGRGELNPLSDVDLMFYCGDRNKDLAEQIAERVLYLLWDLNLDVGYSVRTAKDCLNLAQQDITIRTAMLDARYLAGDEELYTEFYRQVYQPLLTRNTQAFLKSKYEEHHARLSKFGSSVYLLEPNIKEGEGGLRDLHTALWMARVKFKCEEARDLVIKGVLSESEFGEIQNAFDYLWRIRNELHYLSPRKNEQLHFEQQEDIARFLGYKDTRKAPAVEQFMQDFYSQANRVEHLATGLVNQSYQQAELPSRVIGYLSRRTVGDNFFVYNNELKTARKNLFVEKPETMMEAFLVAKRNGVKLSIELKTQIRDNLGLINDRYRRSRTISAMFMEIIRTPGSMVDILIDMHHLKFLNRYIPEFERIYCKVQHDAYHIYTVDIHSLLAVGEIEKLWLGEYRDEKPLLTEVANDIEKRELLVLSVLFHDIGKGEGKDHSNKGADMIPTIARRLHLNKEDSQRLEFLVRRHLDMAHISQRRDLHDDRLIQDFAQTMGMTENLKMLFLLTYADIKAVGPDVWTEWKGFLLQELYEKTYDVLERGNFMSDIRSERVRNRKRKVVASLKDDYGEKAVKERLKTMGMRYLLSHRSWEISDHVAIELQRGDSTLGMDVSHYPESQYTQVVLSTLDVPGLFSMLTGVMAANGINILGAQIYTRSNGTALDILHVNNPIDGGVIDNPTKWDKVRENMTAVLEGRTQVGTLVKKRKKSSGLPKKKRPKAPSRVVFDTDVSREHTVIDIFTDDKVGLLHDISKTLTELGLYIHVAKISTKVDQVADTFYVKDIFGQKVSSEEKLEEIRSALIKCMDEE